MPRYDEYNNSSNSFMTFVMGAVAGAIAVMFLDKDMRAKVETKLQDAKSVAEEEVEKVKTKAMRMRDDIEDKAEEKLVEAQEKIEENRANREDTKPAKRSAK